MRPNHCPHSDGALLPLQPIAPRKLVCLGFRPPAAVLIFAPQEGASAPSCSTVAIVLSSGILFPISSCPAWLRLGPGEGSPGRCGGRFLFLPDTAFLPSFLWGSGFCLAHVPLLTPWRAAEKASVWCQFPGQSHRIDAEWPDRPVQQSRKPVLDLGLVSAAVLTFCGPCRLGPSLCPALSFAPIMPVPRPYQGHVLDPHLDSPASVLDKPWPGDWPGVFAQGQGQALPHC